jgi:peptidoglycan/LPS O-acetylase OafA/YrhL
MHAERMAATHLRLDALLCGVGLRALAAYFPLWFAMARGHRAALVAVGVICWSPNLFIEPSTAFIRTLGLTATYVGSAAFLLAAFHTHGVDFGRTRPIAWVLAKVMAWIGIYSYAIYLWHTTAMGILEREVGVRMLAWVGGASGMAWLGATLAVCTGTVVVGAVASRIVEWPVIRMRDRVFPSNSGALDALPGAGSEPAARNAYRQEVLPENPIGKDAR